ncbi:hypothetical protein EV182_007175, partial [Spiromyces aspiralis]
HRTTKQLAALKFIKPKSSSRGPNADANDKHEIRIEREIKTLSLLYHPHIVRIYDVVRTPRFTMIAMEHIPGGELLQYMRKHGRLKEWEARYFFRQIVSAIDYCHSNCVIHRDLKLENVMLDSDGNVKIIDFGFCNKFYWDRQLDTYCGSPFYAAPEMVKGIKYTGPEVDIWSMGVILFFMLCGRTPFEGENLSEIYARISRGEFILPRTVSEGAGELIHGMLTVDRTRRFTMCQIRTHEWINAGYDKPVSSYVPKRPLIVHNINQSSLKRMTSYGFDPEEVAKALSAEQPTPNPMVTTYHLIEEARTRREKRLAQKQA